MRHGKRIKKLGRKKAHRVALLRNLCRALFIYERIKTTLQKAKEARRLVERLIEFAKKGDLSAKRYIYRHIPDHKLVKIVCEDIAPKFANRTGGYTRIYHLGPRLGDGAEMAILELTEKSEPEIVDLRRKLIERRSLPEEAGEKEKKEKPQKEKVKKETLKEKKEEKITRKEKVKKEKPKKKKKKEKREKKKEKRIKKKHRKR
uniref:Large ribosomal subunit protein bL17 n=1 Tax=candidate division WOR-3 bacterium TaxID=2052148 RepID=A0A7C4X948_UNCW3